MAQRENINPVTRVVFEIERLWEHRIYSFKYSIPSAQLFTKRERTKIAYCLVKRTKSYRFKRCSVLSWINAVSVSGRYSANVGGKIGVAELL